MPCSVVRRVVWLVTAWLVLSRGVHAAVLTGRVIDSAGRPVAGAGVRVWQKVASANGAVADQQVMFDGHEALITNAEGRFATPDVLSSQAYAWVVIEAEGMLAGRSGWLEIGKDGELAAPDIVLKRFRGVIGQVLDRKDQPVAGATVFNSGDGHDRVETKTGRAGKFFLDGVPEGAALLFAEKPGYRLTGMRLPAARGEAVLRLTAADEPDDRLTTLPPLLSLDEESALAHQVLDPWLDETQNSSAPMRKLTAIGALQYLDPLAALKRFDALPLAKRPVFAVGRHGLIEMAIASGRLSPDDARQTIESRDDPFSKVYEYLTGARIAKQGERAKQVSLLEAALNHARRVADGAQRTQSLAAVAEAFTNIGERQRAQQILVEAEKSAELLPGTSDAIGKLALAWADNDPARAVAWLEKIANVTAYQRDGTQLALKLLPDRPGEAVEVWRRTTQRQDLAAKQRTHWLRDDDVANLCYRMATVELSLAEEIAAAAETPALRIRGKGAIAWALSEKQPDQARALLRALLRDDLPRLAAEEGATSRSGSPAVTAAWLLPIAEQVDADSCRELFWRSLALRLPRPRRDHFDFDAETADALLARMLARYDRGAARSLLEPLALSAQRAASAAATEVRAPQTLAVAQSAVQWAREFIAAAAHVDPHWAIKLLAALPDDGGKSLFNVRDSARQAFVWTLARRGAESWWTGRETTGDFWKPRARH